MIHATFCSRAAAALVLASALACDTNEGDDATETTCLDGKCDAAEDDSVDAGPTAIEPAGACADDDIVRIDRPIDPTNPDGPTFQYAVRVSKGSDPDAPVIVHLPGGPGQSSIEGGRGNIKPAASTVLYTDPRGVGCNAMTGKVPSDVFYASSTFAADVIAVLEHLEVDDWAIYGISYGTALATMTASLAVDAGLPAPRAVVLEGILGRAFEAEEDEDAKLVEWKAVRERLPADVLARLDEDEPFGIDPETWGRAVVTMLFLGGTVDLPDTAALVLSGLAAPDTEADSLAFVKALGAEMPQPQGAIDLFDGVGCREIAETAFSEFALVRGELVPSKVNCEAIELDREYDAADYPIDAPIFYIEGTRDPATPLWQTDAHIERQPQTDRFRITVVDTGHNPFGASLVDCVEPLWASFLDAGKGLQDAVNSCRWQTTLAELPAEY